MNKKVRIYCGAGTCPSSIFHLKRLFEIFSFSVRLIDSKEVIKGDWIEDSSLFVMPGGADLPYCRLLNGQGNRKIGSFVERGGRYLGICAGSYYAGNEVEFSKGTDLEITGKRELSFFPGLVKGPTFPPFRYSSSIGMRAVQISSPLLTEIPVCFYHGGGHFCSEMDGVEVLAHYAEAEGTPPAIVHCTVGKGRALLSGVHFEYDPEQMDSTDLQLIESLKRGNSCRLAMIQLFLKRLFEEC